MLNNGNGGFVQGDNIPSSICRPARPVSPGLRLDFNGDDFPDLVGPRRPPVSYVYALNNGNGTFDAPAVRTIDTCGTGDASTADADNDGDIDILIANNRSGPGCDAFDTTIRIALNNGNGTFQADYGVEMLHLQEFALGADFNGDSLTDLMSASPQNGVALGTGGGAFAPPSPTSAAPTWAATSTATATSTSPAATPASARPRHAEQRQRRLYPEHRVSERAVSGLSNVWDLDLGDFNSDGFVDLAVSNTSGNNVGIHFGTGGGIFETDQLRYGTHGCLSICASPTSTATRSRHRRPRRHRLLVRLAAGGLRAAQHGRGAAASSSTTASLRHRPGDRLRHRPPPPPFPPPPATNHPPPPPAATASHLRLRLRPAAAFHASSD